MTLDDLREVLEEETDLNLEYNSRAKELFDRRRAIFQKLPTREEKIKAFRMISEARQVWKSKPREFKRPRYAAEHTKFADLEEKLAPEFVLRYEFGADLTVEIVNLHGV